MLAWRMARVPSPPTTSAAPARPPRAVPETQATKASTVVDQLRAEIVQGRLAPGEKLRLEHLVPRYGVGRTPLREACCRLAAEGLVTIEDQRGFRVAAISRGDLLDLTRTRQQIEPLALRAAIQKGDKRWEGEVTAALHRLQQVGGPPRHGAPLDDRWEQEHGQLHARLLSACDSPLLVRFCASLFEQSERYRRIAAAHGQPTRNIEDEHATLVRTALARDTERACALLIEHIARTADRVLSSHPDLPA